MLIHTRQIGPVVAVAWLLKTKIYNVQNAKLVFSFLFNSSQMKRYQNSKLAFYWSFGAGFEWDLQPVWGVGLLRLDRQHWSVQQLPLDGHLPGLAYPGGRDDPRHLAARSSLQPGCPWHLLMASSFSTCILEANILSIFTFISKFQKSSQCLNSIAFGVAIWKCI